VPSRIVRTDHNRLPRRMTSNSEAIPPGIQFSMPDCRLTAKFPCAKINWALIRNRTVAHSYGLLSRPAACRLIDHAVQPFLQGMQAKERNRPD
jgi:hypothetical protein